MPRPGQHPHDHSDDRRSGLSRGSSGHERGRSGDAYDRRRILRCERGDRVLTLAPAAHRTISIRSGELRYDIVAPSTLTVGDAITRIGLIVAPTTRIIHERAGHTVASDAPVAELRDGDVISLIDSSGRSRGPGRARKHVRPRVTPEPVAAWWTLGVTGLLAAALFAAFPALHPEGYRAGIAAVLIVAAIATGVVLITRARTRATPALGAMMLAPTAVLIAGAVVISPPQRFDATVTVLTACAAAAAFLGFAAVIARDGVVRSQLATMAVIFAAIGAVHAVMAAFDAPATSAAAIIVGAVPIAVRALPATVMDVPAGMFIDFERYQQTRWAVREKMPNVITSVDRERIAQLIARSQARLTVGTAGLMVVLAVFLPLAVVPLTSDQPVALIGQLVLLVCLLAALGLSSRHHSSRPLRMMSWAGAIIVALVAVFTVQPFLSSDLLPVLEAGLLVLTALVVIGIVPVARGARSLFWSRTGDIVEAIVVVLSLPAGLIAAGVVDAIRGWMN